MNMEQLEPEICDDIGCADVNCKKCYKKKELEKNVRDEIINIIKNGGTGDTILTIQYNKETFINQRQLLEALTK